MDRKYVFSFVYLFVCCLFVCCLVVCLLFNLLSVAWADLLLGIVAFQMSY